MSSLSDGQLLRQARRGFIIDTNLLVIYLVGLYSQRHIARFVTKKCLASDFGIMQNILRTYKLPCIVTPQILAEVSNLTFDKFYDPGLSAYLAGVFSYVQAAEEIYVSKDQLLASSHVPLLGFCDGSIIEAAKDNELVVVTEDFNLYGRLLSEGCLALNISHLRTFQV